jgi:ribonuclease BN (tRNA processing enzyme)
MPTLANRVTTRNLSVVFSSDQTGTNPKFVDFAKGANLLIRHLAIAAGATSPLHAAPAVVGRIVQEAGVGRLSRHIRPFTATVGVATRPPTQAASNLAKIHRLLCSALNDEAAELR